MSTTITGVTRGYDPGVELHKVSMDLLHLRAAWLICRQLSPKEKINKRTYVWFTFSIFHHDSWLLCGCPAIQTEISRCPIRPYSEPLAREPGLKWNYHTGRSQTVVPRRPVLQFKYFLVSSGPDNLRVSNRTIDFDVLFVYLCQCIHGRGARGYNPIL